MEHGKPFSATDSPLVDFDAVCQSVRAAVEPARAHAVSLHDEQGDVLWLSESSMGPDEHNAVREAVEAFSRAGSPPALVYDLGDSRSAVLLRAVNGQRAMVGVIMLVMDARVVKQDARGALKVMTPKLQRALANFAAMRPERHRRPRAPVPARPAASAPLTLVNEAPAPPARTAPPVRPAPPMSTAPAPVTPPARIAPAGALSAPAAAAPRSGGPRHVHGRRAADRGKRVRDLRPSPASRGDAGDRPPARRPAPQPHCAACAASGPSDQGQPTQALRSAAAFQIGNRAECSAAGHAQSRCR